jgi:hypothetical protein
VTDIGLPPDNDHVLGMDLVRAAKSKGIPCIVISGTEAVTPQKAVDLVMEEEFRAKGFFWKQELSESSTRRKLFEELVVRETTRPPGRGGDGAPREERSAARRRVVIAAGDRDDPRLLLRTEGRPDFEIPDGLPKEVFYFFLLNVLESKPAGVVRYADLNPLTESESRDKAPEALRGLFHDLNNRLREWLEFGGDESCFVNVRGKGYCLNTHILEWVADDGLRLPEPARRSVRAVATDPHKVQENTTSSD